jgi:hypothetical protein
MFCQDTERNEIMKYGMTKKWVENKMSLNASIRKKDGKERENKRKERRTKRGEKS